MEIEQNRDRKRGSKKPLATERPVAQNSMAVSFHRGPIRTPRRWRLMAWSLAASTIDLLLMFSTTCFLVGGFIFAMGWKMNLRQVVASEALWGALVLSFVGFYVSYLLVLRVFLGCTLGEWSCGLRLGEPRHRLSPFYSMKVHYRFLITLLTGGVTLPILSLVTGVDLAGRWSGLPLVSNSFRAQ